MGFFGIMDWIDEENSTEWRDIGWQRDKAPVWSIWPLTRCRSRLQSMMEQLNREMSVISFVLCFLSTSFYAQWTSILVWRLKVKQLKFPPPICVRSPVLFQIFGLKRCVPVGAGLGYCCHCVTARPTQLEINTGKERKRKANGQRFICKSSIWRKWDIWKHWGIFKQSFLV